MTLDNYRRLAKSLGENKLLLIVYAEFNSNKLIACCESDIIKLYEQDRREYSDRNHRNVQRTRASGSPWANIYLGNFLRPDKFLKQNFANE